MTGYGWSHWRTITKVFVLIWSALIVGSIIGHHWMQAFYYTLFLGYTVICAAQEAIITQQRAEIKRLTEWWR